MHKNDLYHPYVNANGKLVSGAAAFAHHVFTELGGVQAYNDSVGIEYITKFVQENSIDINELIAKKAKKKLFKVV